MKITKLRAREILDSRGIPTLETEIVTSRGKKVWASVPSGASRGSHEAVELRDGDSSRYGGQGVLSAVRKIHTTISRRLLGKSFSSIEEIDSLLIGLDGTENKRKLGANTILSVSLAAARAFASEARMPLYRYLRETYFSELRGWSRPRCMMNIINGGVHAGWSTDFQEYMIVPQQKTIREQVRCGSEVFQKLKEILQKRHLPTTVGDEGGFAVVLRDNEQPLKLLERAVKATSYRMGADVRFSLDIASSEFYSRGGYWFQQKKKRYSPQKLLQYLKHLIEAYPILSLEDPFFEDAWEDWQTATRLLGREILLVGDDLFTTNVKRLQRGIAIGAANAVLIKPNQIGTLTETVSAIRLARKARYRIILSHRSGETVDDFISDFAIACGADFIKAGSVSRGERVAKYNRLMEIEAEWSFFL